MLPGKTIPVVDRAMKCPRPFRGEDTQTWCNAPSRSWRGAAARCYAGAPLQATLAPCWASFAILSPEGARAGKFYFPTSPRFAMIHRDALRRRPFAHRQNSASWGEGFFAQDCGPCGPSSSAGAAVPRLLSHRNPVCAPLLTLRQCRKHRKPEGPRNPRISQRSA